MHVEMNGIWLKFEKDEKGETYSKTEINLTISITNFQLLWLGSIHPVAFWRKLGTPSSPAENVRKPSIKHGWHNMMTWKFGKFDGTFWRCGSMSIIQQKLWSAKIWFSPTAKRNCVWVDWILMLPTRIREAKHHLCPTLWLAWFMPAKQRKNTLEKKTLAIPSTPTNFVTFWNKLHKQLSNINEQISNTIYSLYYTLSSMNSFFLCQTSFFQPNKNTTKPLPHPHTNWANPTATLPGLPFLWTAEAEASAMWRRKC